MKLIDTIYGLEDEYTEIASISQDTHQFDNYSIKLYRHNETNQLVQVDDMCSDSNFYEVSEDEITGKDYDGYVKDCARNWARNGEEDELTQLIAWGLANPKIYAVDSNYAGNVKILSISHYFDYEPIGYVTDDQGDEIIFDSYQDAQDWIDEQEAETYNLSHGEHSRPNYYIIKA